MTAQQACKKSIHTVARACWKQLVVLLGNHRRDHDKRDISEGRAQSHFVTDGQAI